ncbi:MAG TPA: type III pantothenate kinase [Pirellulales bacterium]|nr:type III pantothenate kinase [Pirellulales bacterium]
MAEPFIAVDIGNSRIKFGLYTADNLRAAGRELPEPSKTLDLSPAPEAFAAVADWLAPSMPKALRWWIGSVERNFAAQLVDWLRAGGVSQIVLLASVDLPLTVAVPRPDMVGIDRLLAALAINRLRMPDRPAVVVDLGTAVTVDLVSRDGAFLGGAIMPGIGLAARALHEFTDLLPRLDMTTLAEPPPALGTATVEAMTSGIYWGAIGGVRHLIELLEAHVGSPAQIFLTGGAAAAVAKLVSPHAVYHPHLTLAGIALAASQRR